VKIAIIGAEATGRTVLAKALPLPLVADTRPALLAASGYHTLYEWGAATRGWLGWLEERAAAEARHERFIVDVGALDIFGTVARWAWNGIAPDRLEQAETIVRTATSRYTHVIVTPSAIVAPHAPSRFRSAANARQMTRLLRDLAADLAPQARVVMLQPGDAGGLLEQAQAFVRA